MGMRSFLALVGSPPRDGVLIKILVVVQLKIHYPLSEMTDIAQNEEDKKTGEENPELLRNYDNIDTVEKQAIPENIVELMKKGNLPNPQNLGKIDRVRLKEKTKLVDEV